MTLPFNHAVNADARRVLETLSVLSFARSS